MLKLCITPSRKRDFLRNDYLLFYSWKNDSGTSGHIETCFPDNLRTEKKYERHPDDERYHVFPVVTGNNKNLFIGAGSTVGYKDDSKSKFAGEATPFLYLGFLKLNFD